MKKPGLPISTYKILVNRIFNESIDESWLDWAIEMMLAGYESENLFMLAGMLKPFNQFEIRDLADKTLKDFDLKFDDKNLVLKNYAYFLIMTNLNDQTKYLKTLRELKNICIDNNLDSTYMDFYLLYYAKEDLEYGEVQWYWPDADRSNINSIIKNEFGKWLRDFEDLNVA